jgi:hypothetical protein
MSETYTVIYRTGGTENFRWLKTLPMQRHEALAAKAEIERGGRAARMHKTSLLESIGLPETYS